MGFVISFAAFFRPAGNANGNRGRFLIALGLGASLAQPAFAAAHVGVFESPTALEWLRSTGVECRAISEAAFGKDLSDLHLTVLPTDRVRDEASLRALSAVANHGGKVVAVYW